jgi:hypothetical protein
MIWEGWQSELLGRIKQVVESKDCYSRLMSSQEGRLMERCHWVVARLHALIVSRL